MIHICKDMCIVREVLKEDKLNLIVLDDIIYDTINEIEERELDRELICVRICSGYFSKSKSEMKLYNGWVIQKSDTDPYLQEKIATQLEDIDGNIRFVSINLEKEIKDTRKYSKVEIRNVISGVNNPYWEDEVLECLDVKGGSN